MRDSTKTKLPFMLPMILLMLLIQNCDHARGRNLCDGGPCNPYTGGCESNGNVCSDGACWCCNIGPATRPCYPTYERCKLVCSRQGRI
ncbi:hypothetical protein Leryth_011273 [Lithospermum erythrorhizon]|nr:hypothetical protein Leryth_011273 [Lithospermum erythrorhizon]